MASFFYASAGWREACWLCAGDYVGEQSVRTIVNHISAREKRRIESDAFRLYVTDALYAISRRDMTLTKQFRDILRPTATEKPEAIIERFKAAFGGGDE